MKKTQLVVLGSMLCSVVACSGNTYTLTQQELSLEVNTYTVEDEKISDDIQLFNAFTYLRLNDKELTEDQQKEINIENNVDYSKLGDYTIAYRKDDKDITDTLKVKIVDTTKPIIKLTETEFEVGSDIKEKIELSDNYDDEKTLKENLKIEGYNAETLGKQNISIEVKDRSNNQIELKIEILVKEEEKTENISTQNSTPQNNSNTYAANGGSGNSGSSGKTTLFDANGNVITEEEYYKRIEESTKQAEPSYACPTVPHHMEGNVEVWEGDPDLPCDYIFAGSVGNGGLFNTYDEAFNALIHIGGNAQDNPIGTVRYNDGSVKYSFDY